MVTFEESEESRVRAKFGAETGNGEFCLCHGKLGAAAILYGNGEMEKAERLRRQAVLELCGERKRIDQILAMQKCENYGLMGDIAGIGCGILCELEEVRRLLLVE